MDSVIVLPTYNEAENLRPIVEAIHVQVPESHVLIVDDNSPDGTGKIADSLAEASGNWVHVCHRTQKEGLGRAYLEGFRRALEMGAQQIVQMDADFSHPPQVLPILLSALDDYDFALASRYIKGGGVENWSLKRRLLSRAGNVYAQIVLRSRVRDLTGGFKAFNRRVLEHLVKETIHSHGYNFQIEMSCRAITAGFSYTEVPFVFTERAKGVSKMSQGIIWEALIKTFQLRRSVMPR